jgi:rubrerythrin
MDKIRILNHAIQKEIEAANLYRDAARVIEEPAGKTLLTELASQEDGHRKLLESLPPEQAEEFRPDKTLDRRIGDYLEPRPLAPGSSLQDILIHAIKREEEARHFYQAMALVVESVEL